MICVSTKFLHTYTHFPALPVTSSTLDKSRELCWNLPGDCHARKYTGIERKTYTAVENWRHGAIVPFRHEIRVGSAIFSIYSLISLAACRCWPGTDSCTPETEYLCLKERMQPDFLWYSFTWGSRPNLHDHSVHHFLLTLPQGCWPDSCSRLCPHLGGRGVVYILTLISPLEKNQLSWVMTFSCPSRERHGMLEEWEKWSSGRVQREEAGGKQTWLRKTTTTTKQRKRSRKVWIAGLAKTRIRLC